MSLWESKKNIDFPAGNEKGSIKVAAHCHNAPGTFAKRKTLALDIWKYYIIGSENEHIKL